MRHSIYWIALIFAALLGSLAATSLLEQAPRQAAIAFDAARAKARLAHVLGDPQPHPADSAADDAVRARLIESLRTMGSKPIVRDQFACNELFKRRGVSCARVRNVIAVLGPPTGKALLINAHYDSVRAGPGAADDGIGVATMLDVAFLLRHCQTPFVSSAVETRPRPSTSLGTNGDRCGLRRPLILLFNEGEELGLVGARAFLADPMSRNVNSLINLEARGVEGPVNMFETSRPNASAVTLYANAVARPTANSLSTDVYRLLPNYTDVNSFAARGWLTLNLAPIGNETRYHSAGDNLAALDPATLQHMGDQVLALTEAMQDDGPRPASGNRIFMDLGGRALIVLPMVAGVVLLLVLLVGYGIAAKRRGELGWSAALVIGTMIGSGLIAWLALLVIGEIKPGTFWRAFPIRTHLATYAAILFVGSALLFGIGRRASVAQLRSGFWLMFLAVGGLISLEAPGGIIFFLFPPLIMLAGMAAARWWTPAEAAASAVAILFLYLTWGAMLGLLGELLDNGPMWVFAPLGALLILPVLIEAKPLIGRGSAAIAALLFVGGWAAAAIAPAYSADRQQPFTIQHVTDARTRKAVWSVIDDGAPIPPAFGTGWKRGKLPLNETRRWLSPASPDPLVAAPSIVLLSETRSGGERTIQLRLAARGNEVIELLAPEDSRIRSAGTPGFMRPIDQSQNGKFAISCSGRSCDGRVLQLTTARLQPIHAMLIGSRSGLPQGAAPLLHARPRFARPQYAPDDRIVFVQVTL